jgi:hypothetical protein
MEAVLMILTLCAGIAGVVLALMWLAFPVIMYWRMAEVLVVLNRIADKESPPPDNRLTVEALVQIRDLVYTYGKRLPKVG